MLKNIVQKILSDYYFNYSVYTYDFLRKNGNWQSAKRLVLDKGDGAAVLMIDKTKECALFVKQFRYPVYVNEKIESFLEVCAGVLEEDSPLECVKREAIEETGYEIFNIEKIFDSYMSPGAVTERLHLYIAEYNSSNKVADGGGLDHETEDIELEEIPLSKLPDMLKKGQIRDAKTLLLIQAYLLSTS